MTPGKNNARYILITIVLLLVILLGVMFFVQSMNQELELDGIHPNRPESVPEDAVWVGGKKGGVWIYCEPNKESDICFRCKVYAEVSGVLMGEDWWSTGSYCLEESDGFDFDSIKNMYKVYDGYRIFLKNGKVLTQDCSAFFDSLSLIDSGMTRDQVESIMGIGYIERTDSDIYIYYFDAPPFLSDPPKCYISKSQNKVVRVVR